MQQARLCPPSLPYLPLRGSQRAELRNHHSAGCESAEKHRLLVRRFPSQESEQWQSCVLRCSHCGAGQFPSLKDWETHLTTIFPEVRLKRYMEMRGADGGSRAAICALPALWVGLLYDR